MADPRFDGSGVALVTPFDEGGVNEAVLRALVRFHHASHTAALVVCGSTGEAAAMSRAEQQAAVAAVVAENGGRLPVIAGAGGSDTAEVVQLAVQAKAAGADALLVSAPPYNRPPQRGIVAHVRAILDAADLPVILYNVPSRSAVNMLPATIAELAADERVIGVKEASGDITQVAELARLVGDRVAIWSGNDDQVVPLLALGGRGVISVAANVAPEPVQQMVELFLAGEIVAARALQLRLLPLIGALFSEPNPMPVKAALRWLGFETGPLRAPLVEPEPDTVSAVTTALAELDIAPRG